MNNTLRKPVQLPGTPYWMLEGDASFEKAKAIQSIIIETEIAWLPEVQALKPGDVVLDIGAFVGDTALIFLNRGCEVRVFEPYPDAFECLIRNLKAFETKHHELAEYRVHSRAVGDGRPLSAIGDFGEPGENLGTRMMTPWEGEPSLRIDDLNLPRVDFAKIDVEGCEPMVLDGMEQTLIRCKPRLLIEAYNSLLAKQGFTRDDIFRRLALHGYAWKVAIGREEDDRVDYFCWPEA